MRALIVLIVLSIMPRAFAECGTAQSCDKGLCQQVFTCWQDQAQPVTAPTLTPGRQCQSHVGLDGMTVSKCEATNE